MTELLEVLDKEGIYYKKTNNPAEVLIQCTSGEHSDSHPSMQVNIEEGMFHCWSCKFSGNVVKLLRSLGIHQNLFLETKQPYRIDKMKKKLRAIREKDTFTLPKTRNSAYGNFKGITPQTFKEFGAFFSSEMSLEDYVCVPIYQFGKLKFIEGRLKFNDPDRPKYQRKPTGAPAGEVLFPIDKIEHNNTVILVEGLFDMLNLWQMGYKNVLCMFGANNFNKYKIELLNMLGITKVHILYDGDQMGRTASAKLKEFLEKNDFHTQIFNLPDRIDPGQLTKEDMYRYYDRFVEGT